MDAILFVDDEENVLASLRRALFEEPYEVVTAPDGERALELLRERQFKVVVSDERMVGMQGSELLARVKDESPDTIRIMLTGHATLEAAMKAVNEGEIYRFFSKPWNDHDLKFAIRSAIEKFDHEKEKRRLLETIKSQAVEIRKLEKKYPGISSVQRDQQGSVMLQELSENEMTELFSACEERYGVRLGNR